MNGIQGNKPAGWQWYRLLDAEVKILKYKKITIDIVIYIMVLSDGPVSYLKVSSDDVMNITINETDFNEIRKFFE